MSEKPEITVYGAYWCPDCRRSKQFFGEHQIPYNWVDIEQNAAGEAYVLKKNDGKRIIPTIEFKDGTLLVEPSNAELASKIGLKTKAKQSHYDTIIIGGGPAGLTAALYTAREGISSLVIERAALGGQAATTQWLDNVPGFAEGISGAAFSQQLRQQAERFNVELLQAQEVTRIFNHDKYHCVFTSDGSEYTAETLLVASGSRYKRLNVPGEDDFIGAGIHFCATCDGPFYKGKPVAVIGGGNSAAEESLLLVNYVDHVTLLVRGENLSASQILKEKVLSHPQIQLRFLTEVLAFKGSKGKLESILIHDKKHGEKEKITQDAAFIFIGQRPNTSFLAGSGIITNPWGFITTGHELIHNGTRSGVYQQRDPSMLETSVPGVFAAGDVRAGSTKQVASAAGEGATAALLIREFLKNG